MKLSKNVLTYMRNAITENIESVLKIIAEKQEDIQDSC